MGHGLMENWAQWSYASWSQCACLMEHIRASQCATAVGSGASRRPFIWRRQVFYLPLRFGRKIVRYIRAASRAGRQQAGLTREQQSTRHVTDEYGRALFLLPTDRMGGAERVIHTIVIEAAKSGKFETIEVFVLSSRRTGTLDNLETNENVHVYYTEASSERAGLAKLLIHLARHRYTLVFSSHIHMNAICSVARRLGLLRTERLVSRESTMAFDRDFGRMTRLIRSLYWLYGAQDLIICQTEEMRDSVDRHTGGHLRRLLKVVRNPVDITRVEMGKRMQPPSELKAIPQMARKIVWCGRLCEVKAPIRAVEALRTLIDTAPCPVHLVMIGDGPLRQHIEETIDRLRLREYVTLLGYMSNPAAAMSRCDVGLITSKVEGFPNVILEMIMCGIKAVVTTPCAGGLLEIPGVYVVSGHTPIGIAEEIKNILCKFDGLPIASILDERKPDVFLRHILEDQVMPGV